MQPTKLTIADLFQLREQYLIPLFQRGYVWTLAHQVQPLWQDITDRVDALREHRENARKVGGAEKLKPLRKHFLGAIIVGAPVSVDKGVSTREVIDGQQRTTTLQIMLLAFRDALKDVDDEALDDDVKVLTHNKGNFQSKSDHLKVWPTNVGRDAMRALHAAGSIEGVLDRFPARGSDGSNLDRPPMVQAYLFFYAMLACHIRGKRHDDPVDEANTSDDAKTVMHVVMRSIGKDNKLQIPFWDRPALAENAQLFLDAIQTCFQIMRLQLDEEDDPQIIFETLNARGAPLTPSDLVRNFVFLSASRRSGEDVDALYDEHWRSFDEKPDTDTAAKFWKREERQGRLKNNRLDLLFYHYMSLRKRGEVKVAHVFEEFKSWWEETQPQSIKVELGRIGSLAAHFETMLVPGQKTRFALFCRRLKLLDTATPIPLLFHLLEHRKPEDADFLAAIADLDSYLVRRFVCGLTTKSYNRLFVGRLLSELVEEGKSDAALLRHKLLALEGSSQRWPDDQEFGEAFVQRRLFEGTTTKRVRAVLEGLELGLRNAAQEFTPELVDLSVEHVLPQHPNPSDYPLPEDSAEARANRFRLSHAMGNLTLVTPGFNSSLSNKAFKLKRPAIALNSSLMLNGYFQTLTSDAWNEDAIQARGQIMLDTALKVWPRSAK